MYLLEYSKSVKYLELLDYNTVGDKEIEKSREMFMVRNKLGKKSDDTLLEAIKRHIGLSQYELARLLKWNIGKVDGSTRRLLKENKVFIQVLERNGRTTNLVYPIEYKASLNKVEIPANLLQFANPLWLDSAHVYALDSCTIAIAGKEMPEWKTNAFFSQIIPIRKEDKKVTLEIPEKFKRFYDLERKHIAKSINGNVLLLTISGNIVEEKRYPS